MTEEKAVRDWILKNWGVLSRIARKVAPPVTPQFVRLVAFSEVQVRADHPVVRELLASGWPGGK